MLKNIQLLNFQSAFQEWRGISLFPTAVRQTDPAQTVVLKVVADLHRKDATQAEEGKDQDRPDPTHP